MSIKLYEHNQSAYDLAVSLMAETGKAAVIHPTGTGKSFISFKLAEQHPASRICWFSPSEHIYKTQLENLKSAADGYSPENIYFMTYAKLMYLTDKEIDELKPDYIVLDEFHRCGATEWGKGVGRFLAVYSDVPILGLSATNIRYLDNQRDMADELFGGNVAAEMSLGEAIVQNILLPPVYVTSIYSYQKDLEKYQKRIKRAKNGAVRDAAQKYLDALRRELIKADGLDVIFDKHIKDRHGKFIVFCSTVEHMQDMIKRVPDWFYKIDAEPHIYSVCTVDSASDEELSAFKQDNSKHLKLLFSIDMLNEGIHVEHIAGVILFRPTISPIIYKQQIGRALSASKGKEPIIFDVVNNFENLYSIGSIEQEVIEAVRHYRESGQENKIINANFHVIDEIKDCRLIFSELQESLSTSWDLIYTEAKKYYEKHGDLFVPYSYKSNNMSIGMWVISQRKIRNGTAIGLLTDERIKKLDAIGMVWDNKMDFIWNKKFEAAKAYFNEHGNLDVARGYMATDRFELGKWIAGLRTSVKYDKPWLSKEKKQQLDKIGMIWEKEKYLWESKFEAAKQYYEENGHLNVSSTHITADGTALGSWIKRMRGLFHGIGYGKLSSTQINRLNEIGMIWIKPSDVKWETGYAKAKAYYEKHSNLNVPHTYTTDDGFKLGQWLYLYIYAAKYPEKKQYKTKINKERIEKLAVMGLECNSVPKHAQKWQENFMAVKAYIQTTGSAVFSEKIDANAKKYSSWLYEQKKKRKEAKLTAEQIALLDSLGADIKWDEIK